MSSSPATESAPALTWSRTPLSERAAIAANALCAELAGGEVRQRALRPNDKQRLDQTVTAFALELYVARRDGGSGLRRYSRAQDTYRKRNRYAAWPVTHTTVCKVADWLIASGYADATLGHYRRYPEFGENAGVGKQSRIRATEKLVSFFEDRGVTPGHVGFASWVESVVLREGRGGEERGKRDIDYADTADTIRMRANLQRINAFLAQFRISVSRDSGPVVDLPPFVLRRIFSRGSFERGGRFYGGPWLELPSEDRPALLINGEEVVELDFSGLHPRLIYQLEGRPLPADADPYAVPGWIGQGRRAWVKTAFQQLINADKDSKLRKPPDVPAAKIGKGGWDKLKQAMSKHHGEIEGWFRSGRGIELQRIDSDIAEATLLALADQGVCCLPVHDSFIVPRSHENQLRDAMIQAYRGVLSERGHGGTDPIIHTR
ncbi:hypothetical protein OIK40_10195 [Erythrobacter sp. sf7]|uniref:DNA-directed DNA polymerase family A palm domain-containing protein n=1 Tax=Erythrobacter fulvus TaxID=2987523 RepID=A0ABT5JTX6_9SPHN|nr:hypothetical protein [Erythrobacter fulvus]MDC8755007.1 hypothetical protein [Erythrobacter fulvus]